MNELLLTASFLLAIVGIIGCFAPVLPGPVISWLGLLLLHYTPYADISLFMLIFTGILSFLVTILDNLLPPLGSLKFGGSRRGFYGATIGLFVGIIFFPPFGLFVGSFLGALIGELTGGMNFDPALKASFGAFLGVITGVLAKAMVSFSLLLLMLFYCFRYFSGGS